jgi:hypothetical protein
MRLEIIGAKDLKAIAYQQEGTTAPIALQGTTATCISLDAEVLYRHRSTPFVPSTSPDITVSMMRLARLMLGNGN